MDLADPPDLALAQFFLQASALPRRTNASLNPPVSSWIRMVRNEELWMAAMASGATASDRGTALAHPKAAACPRNDFDNPLTCFGHKVHPLLRDTPFSMSFRINTS